MKNVSYKKGFTLIELLVVVSIISLLASVILTSLNSAKVKVRNTKRLQDIEQLVNAFNLGLTGSNSLPDTTSFGYGGWVCVSTSCSYSAASPTVDAYLSPYISKTADPASVGGSQGYFYNSLVTGWTSSQNGNIFPTGAYLDWNMEGSSQTSNICGKGQISNDYGNGRVECDLELN